MVADQLVPRYPYRLAAKEALEHSLNTAKQDAVRRTSIGQLRSLGLCGIVGALLLLISDWTMLGEATSGQEFSVKWLDVLASMPEWRLTIGGLAGPIGAGFYILGFWQLYLGLFPASRALSFVCSAGLSLSFVCLGAFHAAFPFAAYLKQMHNMAEGNPTVDAAYAEAMAYFGKMYHLGLAPAVISILIMPALLLFCRTSYPRWFVVANPALFWLGCMTFRYIPAPLGGPLFIGSGNLAFLFFFISSTIALRQGRITQSGEREPPMTRILKS